MAAKKKTVFENPYFWAAVGGIGIAYYMYNKKKNAAPATTTGSLVNNIPANVGTIPIDPNVIRYDVTQNSFDPNMVFAEKKSLF
jgi:hypothetical protein